MESTGEHAPRSLDDRELRREPRVPVRTPVRIATIDPETDPGTGQPFFRSFSETSANLSRSGLFVHTAEPLAPGRRLLVELKLPDGAGVEAVGRVAWVKTGLTEQARRGVGIELLGGVPDHLTRLRAFIAQRIDHASG